MMRTRRLGRTQLEVTEIGFGGIPIQRVNQNDVTQIMQACVDAGIRFIDTARGYSTSEEMIGNALVQIYGEENAHPFVIATKSMSRTYEAMKTDVEMSLKLLRVPFIHLYQFHFIKDLAQYEMIMSENGAMRALIEAKAEGKIGFIGITAHSKEVLEHVLKDDVFDTIQFPYNPIENQGESVFELAKKQNVGVIVMKPLAGGTIENGPLSLKYIMNNENVTVAIPGMDEVSQVYKNAVVGTNDLTLTDSEKDEINLLKDQFGDQFCRRCGYCLPCPQQIDIPFQFLLNGYITRYDLEEWAMQRYDAISVHADACINCGVCETRCPYGLPIRQKMKETADLFSAAVLRRSK